MEPLHSLEEAIAGAVNRGAVAEKQAQGTGPARGSVGDGAAAEHGRQKRSPAQHRGRVSQLVQRLAAPSSLPAVAHAPGHTVIRGTSDSGQKGASGSGQTLGSKMTWQWS